MFPAYTLLCFNAAVAVYLIRGWFEVAYIRFTGSPYKASLAPSLGPDSGNVLYNRPHAHPSSANSQPPSSVAQPSYLSLAS
jgi:hypothetical protein